MNKDFARKLVDTLRSGQYVQTAHVFKSDHPQQGICYCVAGVIADLNGVKWEVRDGAFSDNTTRYRIADTWSMACLPAELLEKIGSNDDEIGDLVLKNDTEGYTFRQLADYVEAKYIDVSPIA